MWSGDGVEEDDRVRAARCFIFVMKYIMLTYIRAEGMFMSFVVVECLYLIHGNDATKKKGQKKRREEQTPGYVM